VILSLCADSPLQLPLGSHVVLEFQQRPSGDTEYGVPVDDGVLSCRGDLHQIPVQVFRRLLRVDVSGDVGESVHADRQVSFVWWLWLVSRCARAIEF